MVVGVVHCKIEAYNVYIGRGRCPKTGRLGEWGNPASHKTDSQARMIVDRVEDAVAVHMHWLLSKPLLIEKAKCELAGAILGCWCCSPKHRNAPCHGHILFRAANELDYSDLLIRYPTLAELRTKYGPRVAE